MPRGLLADGPDDVSLLIDPSCEGSPLEAWDIDRLENPASVQEPVSTASIGIIADDLSTIVDTKCATAHCIRGIDQLKDSIVIEESVRQRLIGLEVQTYDLP